MAATASALPPLSPRGAGGVEHEDSNISSPLSEVDDKDDNDEEIEHMQLDRDDNEETIVIEAPKKDLNHTSDSDSVLSDAHSDVNSDANDTEAETERLYDTPKHQRQRDVAVDQFGEGQIFEHTPSKLRRTAATDEDAEHGDEESLSGDDASIGSSGPGIDSPSKPATTKDTSVDDEHKLDSQERKRKRSPGADQSETEQPLRKRTSSVAEDETPALQPDDDTVMHEDEATPANDASGSHSPVEEAEISPRKQPALPDDDSTERETRATKKSTRGSKRKAAATTDVDHETEGDSAVGHDTEQHGEATDPDVDEEIDPVTAHDEELERKHAAYKDWTQIEEMFGVFRDRLYKDRLQRLEEEEQSLLASEPTHPEYLNMKQCLDDRLDQKLREINKELEYRMKAHEKRAVAQRAQIWGQYYQGVREKREKALEGLNKEWYDVQTARRTAHSVQDCGLLFPKDPARRVRNAIAYNTEVSALASIAKYEGFPAGPEMKGASATELEDDLAAIERSRRGRQKPQVQQREDYQPPTFSRLGPAGEQFLKETPWANPNHSAHKMYSQIPGAMDGRVDTGVGRQGLVPAPADTKAALDGPSSKQRSPAISSRLSESPELARTLLNPAHHQMKRVGSLSGMNRGSKTAAA
ncbi:Fc.00g063420.m01.CDS01 [Cosmosporella sp. VM-42]